MSHINTANLFYDFSFPQKLKQKSLIYASCILCGHYHKDANFSSKQQGRFISCTDRCVLGVIPGSFVFMGLSCLCGLVMFAYYALKGCDPLEAGQITDVNQVSIK